MERGEKMDDHEVSDEHSASLNSPMANTGNSVPAEKDPKAEQTIGPLLDDIENIEKLSRMIPNCFDAGDNCRDITISPTINKTTETLAAINAAKTEFCKLPLDPCEAQFIANNITPLLTIISQLTIAANELSGTVNFLASAPYVKPDISELKDSIDLMYDLNEDANDIYDILKKRLRILVNRHRCTSESSDSGE